MDRKQRFAVFDLPPLPRIDLGAIRLGAGARYPSRLIVHGAKGMERGGHGLAIRQVFEKAEVGRVSWQFHVRKEEEQRRRKRASVTAYKPVMKDRKNHVSAQAI